MQKPSIPKGTRDFGPEESAKRKFIIEKIQRQFIKYGFMPLETPTIENLSVLTGKYGEEGDQLLFKVLNSGDFLKNTVLEDYSKGSKHLMPLIAEKGLRYDLTVPFARYVVMNQHHITFPFKRYQIQPVWRADRPQKGRYREFYQCDADIIGSRSTWNETELTLLIHDVFSDIGLDDFILKINHRDILFSMARNANMAGKEILFCATLDKIEKIGREQVIEEIVELGGERNKIVSYLQIIESNADQQDKIKELAGITDSNATGYAEVIEFLHQLSLFTDRKFKVELDFSLARGLSYYTGLIFEVKPTTVEMGSICGGGRYDNLTGVFGLPDVSGVGISFGLDRIYDVLTELDLFPETVQSGASILIISFDQQSFEHGLSVLDSLRNAGISAEIYPEITKIKKQLNYANKLNTPYVITIGSNEIKEKIYPLKNMRTGDQKNYSVDEIISIMYDRTNS